jgi:tagatose 1,6-diphosphate aldolase
VSGVDTEIAVEMIQIAANRLAEAGDELSELDAVAGDGDHGLNISTAFADAEVRIAEQRPESAAEVFLIVSQAFNEGRGGASGALFGAFFGAIGDRLSSSATDDLGDFVDGLDLGARRVREIGRAGPGDKTMLDALQPAVHAAQATLSLRRGGAAVLGAAAAAAEHGADSTAGMHARAGRARYAEAGAVGTRDPGAATFAVIFRAWADAVSLRGDSASNAQSHGVGLGNGSNTVSLDQFATVTGHFAILALDHVRSFATTMRPEDPDSLTPDEMREAKQRLIERLAGAASAVLIDPAHAASQTPEALAGATTGLILGIEDADYDDAVTRPRLLPGWSVERAARAGADAVKISFYFDPDEDSAAAERFVTEVVGQCDAHDLPLLCEPLAQIRDPSETRQRVLEGVRRFGSLGAAVLKIQFPHGTQGTESSESWAEACKEADDLSSSPWVLLSEGREFSEFRDLLTIACRAGASGFVAGRAIWGGLGLGEDALAVSAQRLLELRSVVMSEGAPWNRRREASASSTSAFERGSL